MANLKIKKHKHVIIKLLSNKYFLKFIVKLILGIARILTKSDN